MLPCGRRRETTEKTNAQRVAFTLTSPCRILPLNSRCVLFLVYFVSCYCPRVRTSRERDDDAGERKRERERADLEPDCCSYSYSLVHRRSLHRRFHVCVSEEEKKCSLSVDACALVCIIRFPDIVTGGPVGRAAEFIVQTGGRKHQTRTHWE